MEMQELLLKKGLEAQGCYVGRLKIEKIRVVGRRIWFLITGYISTDENSKIKRLSNYQRHDRSSVDLYTLNGIHVYSIVQL